MMNIQQLQELVAIVEYGSINKAATKLFLSRSTISSSITALEKELGGKLLVRKKSGVILTDFGSLVYGQAKMILCEVDFLKNIGEMGEKTNLTLKIAHVYSPIAIDVFTGMYNKYAMADCEQLVFSILEGSTIETMNNVMNGNAEVGVINIFSNADKMYKNATGSKGLEYTKIADRKLYVFLGKKNPLFGKETSVIDLSELEEYPFAYYSEMIREASIANIISGSRKNTKEVALGSTESLYEFVRRTDAFTIAPLDPQAKGFPVAELRCFEIADKNIYLELGWIKRADHELSKLGSEFVEELYIRIKRLLTLIV